MKEYRWCGGSGVMGGVILVIMVESSSNQNRLRWEGLAI